MSAIELPELVPGVFVRIGKGRNTWLVKRVTRCENPEAVLPLGAVVHVDLVAQARPDHGINGGNNRGALRRVHRGDRVGPSALVVLP